MEPERPVAMMFGGIPSAKILCKEDLASSTSADHCSEWSRRTSNSGFAALLLRSSVISLPLLAWRCPDLPATLCGALVVTTPKGLVLTCTCRLLPAPNSPAP